MNVIELNSIIEQYRPLEALSSLPIAFLGNREDLKALWFNYYLDQNEDELVISIKSIFIVNKDMEIDEMTTDMQLKTKIAEFKEPSLSRQEYLLLLENQFVSFDFNEMNKLLQQAEMQPLLIAYNAVIDYIT